MGLHRLLSESATRPQLKHKELRVLRQALDFIKLVAARQHAQMPGML